MKRFEEGEPYASTLELVADVLAGRWVMWNGRPKHPSFMISMKLRTIQVVTGSVCRAIDRKVAES